MMKKIIKDKQGFSLLEIIVTIFIIGLLSAIMLANYKEGNRASELNLKTQSLAANIRMAQNNTLGSVKYGNFMPEGGWGVYLNTSNPNSYKIFANLDYESGSLGYDGTGDESNPSKGGKTIVLGPEVDIGGLSTSEGSVEELSISFLPPDPQTIIYDGTSTSTEATVILESRTGKEKRLKINSFGLIEILD